MSQTGITEGICNKRKPMATTGKRNHHQFPFPLGVTHVPAHGSDNSRSVLGASWDITFMPDDIRTKYLQPVWIPLKVGVLQGRHVSLKKILDRRRQICCKGATIHHTVFLEDFTNQSRHSFSLWRWMQSYKFLQCKRQQPLPARQVWLSTLKLICPIRPTCSMGDGSSGM